MNISNKTNYSPKRYFCWQDTWHLPFESMGSVLEKFKFANEIDARIAKKFYKNDNEFNNLISNKLLYYEEVVKKEYLWFLLEHSNVSIEQIFKQKFTFCLECMKVGYHSLLHQLKTFKKCLFHNQVLMDCCPNCSKTFRYNDPHYFGIPYECTCGFKFHQVNHNFFEMWAQSNLINTSFKTKWQHLKEDKNFNFSSYKLLFPINEEMKDVNPYNIYTLMHSLESIFFKESLEVPRELIMIKSPTKKFKEKYYNLLIDEYSKFIGTDCHFYMETINKERRNSFLKHFDLYINSKQVFKSICRYVRKKILKKHRNCIKNLPKMLQSGKICNYALLYISWRSYLEGGLEGLYKWDRTEHFPTHNINRTKLERFSLYWKDPFNIINEDILLFTNVDLVKDYLLIRWIANHYLSLIMLDSLNRGIRDIELNTIPFRDTENSVPFMFFLFPQNPSLNTNKYLFANGLSISSLMANISNLKCEYDKKNIYKPYVSSLEGFIEEAFS